MWDIVRSAALLAAGSIMFSGCAENSSDDLTGNGLGLGEFFAGEQFNSSLGAEASLESVWIPRADPSIGLNGVHYEGERVEMITWGPQNLGIDPIDGSFWIADTPGRQILHTDRSGNILKAFDVSKDAVGAAAVAVNGDDMAVISVASIPPKILRYTKGGDLLRVYDLPQKWEGSMTGVEIDETGGITLERSEGFYRHLLSEADGEYELTDLSGRVWAEGQPSVYGDLKTSPIDSRNLVTLRRFLAEDDGKTYVYAEEWRDDEYGRANVDAYVRRFNAAGEEEAIARVPLASRYTFVGNGGVQYDPDTGQVLALMTAKDGASIEPIEFVPGLVPLPDLGKPAEDSGEGEATISDDVYTPVTCTISKTTIGVNGVNYLSTTVSIPAARIASSSSCTSRTIPGYLAPYASTGGSFNSVPYSWGDYDTVDGFWDYMSASTVYYAGDANDTFTSPTSCGRGVDCSGFITRVWGRTTKLGTSTIPGVAASTSSAWQVGDVYNYEKSHVTMYGEVVSSTVYRWIESTVYNDYDRVIMIDHPMSFYGSSYVHRRYNYVCP